MQQLERQLRDKQQEVATLREAVLFARYEIGEVRRSAMAADDRLRRAAAYQPIDDDPLDWVC